MYMENNFPVKYAILELKEDGGYLSNYSDITRGFIVSKCYVLESVVKYLANGKSKVFYKVFFPFQNLNILKLALQNNQLDIGQKLEPTFNLNGEANPTTVVSNLFDTYEDAKRFTHIKNEFLKNELPIYISSKEYKEYLSICQLFEELTEANTEDMLITEENIKDKHLQLIKTL